MQRCWSKTSAAQVESFAAFAFLRPVLTGDGEPEQLRGARVSANFFDVMDAPPSLGRLFTAAEDQEPIVVLGHGLWLRRFGGDPGIVGRTLLLDSLAHTVVGVVPASFRFPERDLDLWVPLQPGPQEREQRGSFWLRCVARVKPGVPLSQAQREMDALANRLAEQHDADRGLGVKLVGLQRELTGPIRPALLVLGAAALGILLIACANVAAMLTARGAARRREVAIRTALGAGHRRLVRQLLTEALALFLAGGVSGLLLAAWGVRVLSRSGPPALPQLRDVSLDAPMVTLALVLSFVTGILFGLVPCWDAARADIVTGLAGAAKGTTHSFVRQRFRLGLVIVQMAVATTVLAGAGLLIRSLLQMQRTEMGFETRGLLTARIELPKSRYREAAKRVQFVEQLLDRVRALAGVSGAGATSTLLLSGLPRSSNFTLEGSADDIDLPLTYDAVTPGFFRTMGITLVRGRLFTQADRAGATRVALVNERAARLHWPGIEPIGRRFKLGGPGDDNPWLTIVGVVADTRRAGVEQPVFTESYLPHAQDPEGSMTLVVHGPDAPSVLAPALRAAVRELDSDLPLAAVASLETLLGERTAGRRFTTSLLAGYGALGVALAAVGLYGLLAYLVALRRQEIAVRLALGASARDVLRLVMRQAFVMAASGAGIGVLGAVALARGMRGLLFETHPADPVAHLGVAAVLLVAALAAAWAPGRRALRVSPAAALRSE